MAPPAPVSGHGQREHCQSIGLCASFEEDNSECLLLVDADNAFNKLNRKVSLENIKRLSAPIYTYLNNSYNTPAMLYLENGDHILSQEGVTQGDNAAMAMYALSTRPLIQALSNETANDEVKGVVRR